MRIAPIVTLILVLSASNASAQSVSLQLVPTTTTCSPSGGFNFCADTGIVSAGALSVGTYARTIYMESAQVVDMFYGPGKAGCGPVHEKVVVSVLPPIAALGAYLNLEAVTFGRPGSTELCAALGTVGASAAPSGNVSLTSPDLAAFKGLSWSHPTLSSHYVINLRLQ